MTADVYFWHIPKTGGTSVTQALLAGLPGHHRYPGNTLDQLLTAPPEPTDADAALYCGHFGAYLEPLLTRPLDIMFTVLREPVALAWSYYQFTQRIPEFNEPGGVQGRSLEELLDHEVCSRMFTNVQARWLALDAPPDSWHGTPRISTFTLHSGFELQDLGRHGLADPVALQCAAESRLRGMTAVGDTEDLGGLIATLAEHGLDLAWTGERLNAAPEALPVPRALQRRLEALNTVDMHLYALKRAGRI